MSTVATSSSNQKVAQFSYFSYFLEIIPPILLSLIAAFLIIWGFYDACSKSNVFPFQDTDGLLYLDLVQSGHPSFTTLDNPQGRPVGWPSAVIWGIHFLSTFFSFNLATIIFAPLFIILLTPFAITLGNKVSGVCGAWAFPIAVFLPTTLWTWSPGKPDHRAVLAALICLSPILAYRLFLQKSSTRDNIVLGILCGAISGLMVWLSPMASVPLLIITWSAMWIVSQNDRYFIFIGFTSLLTISLLYYIEKWNIDYYRPEIATPLWGLLLLGFSILLAYSRNLFTKRERLHSAVYFSIGLLLFAASTIFFWIHRQESSLFNPVWNTMGSQIIEMMPNKITDFLQQDFMVLIIMFTAIATTNGRLRLMLFFCLLILLGLTHAPQRLMTVFAPTFVVISMLCIPRQKAMIPVLCALMQIALSTYVEVGDALSFSTSNTGKKLITLKSMSQTVSPESKIIAPIDDGLAIAYYTKSHVLGSLHWENMDATQNRGQILLDSPEKIPSFITTLAWPLCYKEEFVWHGKINEPIPECYRNSLMEELANARDIPGFKKIATPYIAGDKLYTLYIRQ